MVSYIQTYLGDLKHNKNCDACDGMLLPLCMNVYIKRIIISYFKTVQLKKISL